MKQRLNVSAGREKSHPLLFFTILGRNPLIYLCTIHHSDSAGLPFSYVRQCVNLDYMLAHKSIPEIIKAAEKKGGKNLTSSDAAEAISTKYGPTVPKELTQKEIDELADYLVKIYP